ILDQRGKLVRSFASTDRSEAPAEKDLVVASYWLRPPQLPSAKAGSHRFVWDLHYPPPEGPRRVPVTAVYRDTATTPPGPWVQPGEYRVRLTVGDQTVEQPLTVKMDPRVKTPPEALAQQFELSMQCYDGARQAREALAQVRKLRAQVQERRQKAGE